MTSAEGHPGAARIVFGVLADGIRLPDPPTVPPARRRECVIPVADIMEIIHAAHIRPHRDHTVGQSDAELLLTAVRRLLCMQGLDGFEGTSNRLLRLLMAHLESEEWARAGWARSPAHLAAALSRARVSLAGREMDFSRASPGSRLIRLRFQPRLLAELGWNARRN